MMRMTQSLASHQELWSARRVLDEISYRTWKYDEGDDVYRVLQTPILDKQELDKPIKPDEDGIRTHACNAQWISSPSP